MPSPAVSCGVSAANHWIAKRSLPIYADGEQEACAECPMNNHSATWFHSSILLQLRESRHPTLLSNRNRSSGKQFGLHCPRTALCWAR